MVYNKLLKNIKTPFKMEGGIRIDDTPVHKALREALANCLVNTDFYLPRAVVIKVDREKIVLENPGSVRTGKKQMLKGGISDPRNKSLMKMFNLINIGERAGSGVPDIYSVWKDEGWEEPIVEEQYGPDRTILTLPLVKKKQNRIIDKKQPIKTADKKQPIKTADKTNGNKEKVIEFLKENGTSKTVDIAGYIRLSDRRTRTILKIMTEEGIIIHEGNNKNRVYRLNSNEITNG